MDSLQCAADLSFVDSNDIAQCNSPDGARDLVSLLMGAVLKSGDKFVERIIDLDEELQGPLQSIAAEAMERFPQIAEETSPRSAGAGMSPMPRETEAVSPLAGNREDAYAGATNLSATYLDELEAKNDEIARFKAELVTLQKTNADLQNQMDELVQERDARRSRADEGDWKIKELEYERDQVKDSLEEATRALDRKNVTFSKMQDELDILRSKAKKVDSAERARAQFEQQMEKARQKLAGAADLKVQYEGLREERDRLEVEKDDLQAKLGKSKRDFDKAKRERDELDLELDEIRSSTSANAGGAEELQRQLTQKTVENEQLRLQLESAHSNEVDDDVGGLADELGGESLGDDLGGGFEKLTSAMKAKLAKYDALRAENEDLETKLADLSTVETKLKRATVEKTKLSTELSALRTQLAQKDEEISNLAASVSTAAAGAASSSELESLERENEALKRDQANLTENLAESNSKCERITSDNRRLKNFLREAKVVIENQQLKIRQLSETQQQGTQEQDSRAVQQAEADRDEAHRQKHKIEEELKLEKRKYQRQLDDMSTAFYNQRRSHFRDMLAARATKAPSFLARQQLAELRRPNVLGQAGSTSMQSAAAPVAVGAPAADVEMAGADPVLPEAIE
eukprot:SAG31_NODE_3699_length_3976_cov_2.373227_2_plen_632_part_00